MTSPTPLGIANAKPIQPNLFMLLPQPRHADPQMRESVLSPARQLSVMMRGQVDVTNLGISYL
jgi:hypothetical protein